MKLRQRNPFGLGVEDAEALAQLVSGVKLYGFMGGLFGRDSYHTKTIIEVNVPAGRITVYEHDERYDIPHGNVISRRIDGEIYTWAGVIKASNEGLEEMEREDSRDS